MVSAWYLYSTTINEYAYANASHDYYECVRFAYCFVPCARVYDHHVLGSRVGGNSAWIRQRVHSSALHSAHLAAEHCDVGVVHVGDQWLDDYVGRVDCSISVDGLWAAIWASVVLWLI